MSGTLETLKLHGELKYWKDQNGMNVMPSGLRPELNAWFGLVSEITAKPAAAFSFDQLQQLHNFSSFFAEGAPSTGLHLGVEREYKTKLLPLVDSALKAHPDYKAYKLMQDYYDTHVPKLLHCIEEPRPYLRFYRVSEVTTKLEGFVRSLQQMDANLSNYLAMNSHLGHVPLYLQAGGTSSLPAFSPVVSTIFVAVKNAELRDASSPMDTAADIFRRLHITFENGGNSAPNSPEAALGELYNDCANASYVWNNTVSKIDQLANTRSRGKIAI